MKKLLLILLLFTFVIIPTHKPYAVSFKSFRRDTGILLSRCGADWEGDYRFLGVNDSIQVVIDNLEKTIILGNERYEFMNIPSSWNVHETYQTVKYECIELSSLEKVFIYLIEYDDTENYRLLVIRYDMGRQTTETYNLKKK